MKEGREAMEGKGEWIGEVEYSESLSTHMHVQSHMRHAIT